MSYNGNPHRALEALSTEAAEKRYAARLKHGNAVNDATRASKQADPAGANVEANATYRAIVAAIDKAIAAELAQITADLNKHSDAHERARHHELHIGELP